MSDVLPPAGSLLIMLNTFADTFQLSAECDNCLRSSIPASTAYEVLKVFTESDDLYRMEDPSSVVISTAHRMVQPEHVCSIDFYSERLFARCIDRELPKELIHTASVVQAMTLVDNFCDACNIAALGEKELKFAIPFDSMIFLVFDLFVTRNTWVSHPMPDFIIVSNCRRIRHARGIDIGKDPVMRIVHVNRSTLCKPKTPMPLPAPRERNPGLESISFPLNMHSVWKFSGPCVVFVLSLTEIEEVVQNWIIRNNVQTDDFFTKYPLDCVIRGIKASPYSVSGAIKLIEDSLDTKNRYIFHSLSKLRQQLESVVADHELSELIHTCLLSKVSLSYVHMIVFETVNKLDCPRLAKGPKRITISLLRKLMTPSARRSLPESMIDEPSEDEEVRKLKEKKGKQKDQRDARRGGRWTKEEWDEWDNRNRHRGISQKGRAQFKASVSRCRETRPDPIMEEPQGSVSNPVPEFVVSNATPQENTESEFVVSYPEHDVHIHMDEEFASQLSPSPMLNSNNPDPFLDLLTPSTVNVSLDLPETEMPKPNIRNSAPVLTIETFDDLIDI